MNDIDVSRSLETDATNITAFVIMSNVATQGLINQVENARKELPQNVDLHVIGFFPEEERIDLNFKNRSNFHAFREQDFRDLGYPEKVPSLFKLIPGNCDLVVIAFAKRFGQYKFIWHFEDDVRFTGNLGSLLQRFSDSESDLLCTSVAPHPPGWAHRPNPGGNAPDLPSLRAFLPAFRVSSRLIEALDKYYTSGGFGHHEHTWPFVATCNALIIEDFGGNGPFVRTGNQNKTYTSNIKSLNLFPGTFRYRPPFKQAGKRPDTLYHPVKENLRFRKLASEWAKLLLKPVLPQLSLLLSAAKSLVCGRSSS